MDITKYIPFWLKEATLTQERRDELQLVLESEGDFYRSFVHLNCTQKARMLIELWLRKNKINRLQANTYDRELLSQHFCWHWDVELKRHSGDAAWLFDKFNPEEPNVTLKSPTQPQPQPQLQENLMIKLIKIETCVFVNGADVSNYADADLYSLIAEQEKAIGELEKIQTKPKRLQNEINERRAGIEALVKMLDERDETKAK